MKNLFNKIKPYIKTHKTGCIIVLIIVLVACYYGYGKLTNTTGETRYVTSKVQLGTVVSSVTGSGQVSALNQIDVKAKVSGDITYLSIQNGQKVFAGTLLAQINTTDAQKSIRDAEAGLESAKISLEKLKLQNSNENMNADLLKAYDDGFNTVSNSFLDIPSIMIGLENLFVTQSLSDNSTRMSGNIAQDYRTTAETAFYKAKNLFEKNRKNYRLLSLSSPKQDIENIIMETYETTKSISDALKSMRNFVDYLAEDTGRSSDYTSSQNTLSGYTSTINGHLSNLLSIKTNIKTYKDAFPNASLDLQSSELSVRLKNNALQDAKDKLGDYNVRAPFDGTIAIVSVKKLDSISSGTSVATLITKKQLAEITLNEVDVAKIKVGQKTTLTFDAIPDLSITGEVAEIDSIGTVSQGVVNYVVKIGFDTQDDRIKPGMSTGATIITDIKQEVLVVPNSAVKNQNSINYVETFKTELSPSTTGVQGSLSITPPDKIIVEVGLSNNTQTEIISGLKAGDIIVTKVISGTTTTKVTPSILNSMGGNRGGNLLH